VWKGSKESQYSLKDAYSKIMGEHGGEEDKVYHNLWNVKAVLASQICAWRDFFLIGCLLEIC